MSDFSFVKIFFSVVVFLTVFSCAPRNEYVAQGTPRYENFYQPDSRLYKNPYQEPPRSYYPYYDTDYYYVPPQNYYYSNPYEGGSNRSPVGRTSTPADSKY